MLLNEQFQICLLALASRYSNHVLDINEVILGSQSCGTAGWTCDEVIDMLQNLRPEVLQAAARLVIDEQKSEIYLIEQSEEIPAIWIHCRGRIPVAQTHIFERKGSPQLKKVGIAM